MRAFESRILSVKQIYYVLEETNMELKNVIPGTIIPIYTLINLEKFDNTLIHRKYVVKYGEDELRSIFKKYGFEVKLVIYCEQESIAKYPKGANYILERQRGKR